jgi:hypothetical protein
MAAPVFGCEGFQNAVESYAEAFAEYMPENPQEYTLAKEALSGRCANIIEDKFQTAWAEAHPPIPVTAPVPVANANANENASSTITVSSNGSQGGGGRRRTRRYASNMSWLRRRVNSMSLRNLQREENRLSEEEDHDMPGRGWRKRKQTRRHRRRA